LLHDTNPEFLTPCRPLYLSREDSYREYGRTNLSIIEKKPARNIDKADPGMAQYNPNAMRGYNVIPDEWYNYSFSGHRTEEE
jgi:hypothetical protein